MACLRYISGTKLDERVIRCDIDPGYKEGRQFGRGKSGGQVRDEFRQEFDSGRGELVSVVELTTGGWGHQRMEEERRRQDQMRSQIQFDTYASAMGGLGQMGADVPKGDTMERTKRERSEEDRRDDDEGKRFRGGDEE